VYKASLDLPDHKDNVAFQDFPDQPEPLDRRDSVDNRGQRETRDRSDRLDLQDLLDLRAGLGRRVTRVERASPVTLDPSVLKDNQVRVVHRDSLVSPVHRDARGIGVRLVTLAGREALEQPDLVERKASKDRRDPLGPSDLSDSLDHQVSVPLLSIIT